MVQGLPFYEGRLINKGVSYNQWYIMCTGVSSPLLFFENLKESHINSFQNGLEIPPLNV